jgi:hypothetical protein
MTSKYREAYTVLRGAGRVFFALSLITAVTTIPAAVYLDSWQVGKYGLAFAGLFMGASIILASILAEVYGRELRK